MKPLQTPRHPTFSGIEETPWGEVDKSFHSFLKAFYTSHKSSKVPDDAPTSFKDCSKEIRKWMSNHSILGNPDSDSFSTGVMLPVVNPNTGRLNRGAVRSAEAYANRVKGISKKTLKDTRYILSKLYLEYFSDREKVDVENLKDIISTLKEFESKKEILALIRKDNYINTILTGISDDECIAALEEVYTAIMISQEYMFVEVE